MLSIRLENPGEHMTFPEGLFKIRKQLLITDIQSFLSPWLTASISGYQSLHHIENCGVVFLVDILHNAHFRAPQSTLNIKMKRNPLHDGSLFQTLAYTEKFFIMKSHTAWHRVLKNGALLEDPLNATLKIIALDCPHYEILLLYQYPNLLNGVPEELMHTDFFNYEILLTLKISFDCSIIKHC